MQNQEQHDSITDSRVQVDSASDTRVVRADVEEWLRELIIPLLVQNFIDTQMSPKEKENE